LNSMTMNNITYYCDRWCTGVENETLQFPPTAVPAAPTTYFCAGFVLPNATDYHVIAINPVINASDVVHHMLLFVCKDEPSNSECSPNGAI